MTQQSERQRRYRGWANSKLTFNGDKIAAGQVVSGLTGLNYNNALTYICQAISGNTSDNLPNVEAAAAKRLAVLGGWDSVGDELPLVPPFNFTTGGSFPGLTFGNPVAGARSRDSLEFVASGEARTSSLGLLCEQQTTNKCTNTNLKPTDTSGTTPDAAWTKHQVLPRYDVNAPAELWEALDALDPQGNVTAIYFSESNAAGQISISGVTGNTNVHTPSTWLWLVSGSVSITLSGGTNDPVTTTGEWIRKENPGTPVNAGVVATLTAQEASVVYWFGNQLEENSGRTSIIEVAGATATRLGDAVSYATSQVDPSQFTGVVEFEYFLEPKSGAFNRMTQVDSGAQTAGTYLGDILRHTNLVDKVSAGDGADVDSAFALTKDTIIRTGFGSSATQKLSAVNGTYVGAATNTPPGGYTTWRFGCSVLGEQLNGYIRNAAIYPITPTQADLERLTAI